MIGFGFALGNLNCFATKPQKAQRFIFHPRGAAEDGKSREILR